MRLDPDVLTDTILIKSPAWTRAELASHSSWRRHDAARELARVIVEELREDGSPADPAQLGLPV